jgi:hypothetical protein
MGIMVQRARRSAGPAKTGAEDAKKDSGRDAPKNADAVRLTGLVGSVHGIATPKAQTPRRDMPRE